MTSARLRIPNFRKFAAAYAYRCAAVLVLGFVSGLLIALLAWVSSPAARTWTAVLLLDPEVFVLELVTPLDESAEDDIHRVMGKVSGHSLFMWGAPTDIVVSSPPGALQYQGRLSLSAQTTRSGDTFYAVDLFEIGGERMLVFVFRTL